MITAKVKRAALYLAVGVLGFVLGGVGLYLHRIRSGPRLEPWHATVLKTEFTVDRVDEIGTFEDYLRLEDELFTRLDREIYDTMGTGPAYGLARYSAGSLSDPRQWERNWNRSFELVPENPPAGVLLLHGMSDSPYSLRALGESLVRQGYRVVGLRLPGHGTIPSGMTTVRWQDMAAVVRLGVEHLADEVGTESVHIVGYSTGAPLALDYCLEVLAGQPGPMPRSLVLISPAIGVARIAALAKWQGRLSRIPGLEKAAWTAIEPEFDPFKYNSFTTNAGDLVFRLTRRVARAIEARSATEPIADLPRMLLFQSTVDATVSVDSVIDNLLDHLAPDRAELVLYDINRQEVAASVLVSDPGPLARRLMEDDRLPFALTLITNEDPTSQRIVGRRKGAMSADVAVEPMDQVWPRGLISLSHVALPFPPDDPLYGIGPRPVAGRIFLGEMAVKGEHGLLRFPASWLMRLRYNPFYDYQERRILAWLEASGP